jgi:hypothetical protein
MNRLKRKISSLLNMPQTKDHKHLVIEAFEKKQEESQATIKRRDFFEYLLISTLSVGLINACSTDETVKASMSEIAAQEQFQLFWHVLFPTQELGLDRFANACLNRVMSLQGDNAKRIIKFYAQFEKQLTINSWYGLKDQKSPDDGLAAISDILRSDNAKDANEALDIIYNEIFKVNGMLEEMWGRPFSAFDKKCLYWETYDKPVV